MGREVLGNDVKGGFEGFSVVGCDEGRTLGFEDGI